MWRAATVLALVVLATGCPKKATWFHNERGGYTLVTDARTFEQALIRFHRTGDDICGRGRYQLSSPIVLREGYSATLVDAGQLLTMSADLTCLGPQ